MSQPSIRRTLLIRCGIGVGVLLCLLSCGVYLLAKGSLYRELDDSISQTAALLANQVELEHGELNFEWKEGIGTNMALIEEGFFQFWSEKTGATTRSPGLRNLDLPRFTGTGGSPLMRSIRLPNGHRAHAIGLRIYPFVLPEEMERMKLTGQVIDPKTRPQILVVARDSEPVHHTLARLRWTLIGGSLLTLALGFLVIDRVVRTTLRSIDDLTTQMQARSGHQLDSALHLPRKLPTELTGLARNFDSLLARAAAMRQRERDFIRHAAHELRTPIAGLQATTELALSQPREMGSYIGYLETCRSTSTELTELVKRLSALARIGQTSSSSLVCETLDANRLLHEAIARFSPALVNRDLHFEHTISISPEPVIADPTLLGIIFNNLLDNAISYATRGATIHISQEIASDRLEIRFANPTDELPEDTERLFEPLFRKESSRNDAGSHLGIGLTLSLEAATAMHATLIARKTGGGGIEFILSLPRAV